MKREEIFPSVNLMNFSAIKKLYQKMEIIIRDKCSYPYFLRRLSDAEIINSNFMRFNQPEDYYKEVNFSQFSVLTDTKVFIPYYNNPRLFNPTVREIISQIPERFEKSAVALEIIVFPKVESDMLLYPKEFEAGFHVCTVRLYQVQKK